MHTKPAERRKEKESQKCGTKRRKEKNSKQQEEGNKQKMCTEKYKNDQEGKQEGKQEEINKATKEENLTRVKRKKQPAERNKIPRTGIGRGKNIFEIILTQPQGKWEEKKLTQMIDRRKQNTKHLQAPAAKKKNQK